MGMADEVPKSLSKPAALKKIREIAADTSRIVVIPYAEKRIRDRQHQQITRRQIDLCCQKGSIQEGPFLNQHGHWQVNLFRMAAGEELTCVVAINWPAGLLEVINAFRPGR